MAGLLILALGLRNMEVFPKIDICNITLQNSSLNYTRINTIANKHTYTIHSTKYDKLALQCSAPYPTQWIFRESPAFNPNIQEIRIRSRTETTNTTFLFASVLQITLLSSNFSLTSSFACENIHKPNSVTWINVKNMFTTRQKHIEGPTVEIYEGTTLNLKHRPTVVRNCKAHLYVDQFKEEMWCQTLQTNKEFIPKVYNVTSLNEMYAFVEPKHQCGTIVAATRCSQTYCVPVRHVITTRNIFPAAAVICGDGPNRITLPIFKTGNRISTKMSKSILEEIFILEKNVTLDVGTSHEFTCYASIMMFTNGFKWFYQKPGEVVQTLENGTDSIDEDKQIIISKINITFNYAGIGRVICSAYIWGQTSGKSNSSVIIARERRSISANIIDDADVRISEIQNVTKNKAITNVDIDASELMIPLITSVIAFIVVLVCCLILLLCAHRKIRSQSLQLQTITEEEIDEFEKGNPKADTALFLPYNMEFEIPRDKLHIGNVVLGNGQFGIVQKGRCGCTTVAIKSVKKSNDSIYFKALLSELKIMCYVGRHVNIVNLVGACTRDLRKGELFLVFEFCANGNMQQFLKSSRKAFVDSIKARTLDVTQRRRQSKLLSWVESQSTTGKKFVPEDLALWSHQIASGMEYLTRKNIIHGDLAARNILITESLHAKLGDFGLSKQLFDYSIYVQKQHCPLPLKWMAPESLQDMEFSIQSDAWSFGIVLWEIYSLGELPYTGVDWNYNSWKILRDGFRMEKPQYASEIIYKIMLECWQKKPGQRPTFKFLQDFFAEEVRQLLLLGQTGSNNFQVNTLRS